MIVISRYSHAEFDEIVSIFLVLLIVLFISNELLRWLFGRNAAPIIFAWNVALVAIGIKYNMEYYHHRRQTYYVTLRWFPMFAWWG